MELLDSLFSWVVISAIILLFIGTAVGVMSTAPPEFLAAKWLFTAAATLLLLRMGLWLATAQSRISLRLILVFVLFGSIGVVWVGALRWVTVRESAAADALAALPRLRVATALEADDEHRVFRLSVWNDGESLAIAEAKVIRLTGGEQTHDTLMPLNLGWTQDRQHIPAHEVGRVQVVHVSRKGDVLMIGDRSYLRHLTIHSSTTGDIIPVSFCLRVTFLNANMSEERAFRLVPDHSTSLFYRAEPLLQPCA